MSRAIEQRAANAACASRAPILARDGVHVVLAFPTSKSSASVLRAQCKSAASARHAVELFPKLNVGTTPEARLRAAVLYAEAAPIAAARRMRGGPR